LKSFTYILIQFVLKFAVSCHVNVVRVYRTPHASLLLV